MAPKPEVQQVLDMVAAASAPPMSTLSPAEARESYVLFQSIRGEQHELAAIEDRTIPGPDGDIPLRVYTPKGSAAPRAALVWYHGGGWVIGSIDTHDSDCQSLCERAGVVVLSVEYRLAPEHSFPACFDDAVAALRWIVANADELAIDPSRIAVGGDSAGGNLTAAVCLAVRGEIAIREQVLIYPVTDLTMQHPSYDENADGYLLTRDTMKWFIDSYLQGHDPTDPRVSPLHADDVSGAPPALVITAEYDPLRDEGEAYAEKLRAAGVEVELIRYDGQVHGFFGFNGLWPDATDAHERVAAALRAALA